MQSMAEFHVWMTLWTESVGLEARLDSFKLGSADGMQKAECLDADVVATMLEASEGSLPVLW